MPPQERLSAIDSSLRLLVQAIHNRQIFPLTGNPAKSLAFLAQMQELTSDAASIPPEADAARRTLAEAGCTFFRATSDIAYCHTPTLQHAWRRPGRWREDSENANNWLLHALEAQGWPDRIPLADDPASAHARVLLATTLEALSPSVQERIQSIDRTARGTPQAPRPSPGPLLWRRFPGLRMLWHTRRASPYAVWRMVD